MNFDYYQIKGKWNAANVTRRAEKLEEAEAAADELEAAGADGVEIVGIKSGKRETLRGKRAKRAGSVKIPSKNKKVFKAPKMTVKADKKKPKKTAVKMRGTTGYFITDYKTEKAAKKAADNIKKLGYKADVVEPTGQIDLFSPKEFWEKPKRWHFTRKEIDLIIKSMYDKYSVSGKSLGVGGLNVLTTFEKAQNTTESVDFDLSRNEIDIIFKSLLDYRNKQKPGTPIYYEITKLKESLTKGV